MATVTLRNVVYPFVSGRWRLPPGPVRRPHAAGSRFRLRPPVAVQSAAGASRHALPGRLQAGRRGTCRSPAGLPGSAWPRSRLSPGRSH